MPAVTRRPTKSFIRWGFPGWLCCATSSPAGAVTAGLSSQRVTDLVLIANELTSNVVRHGGGTGSLRLWHDDTTIYCEVADRGAGIADPEHAGLLRSRPDAVTGRGLWMIRQLSDEVKISSGPAGTTVTVAVARPVD